MADARQRAARIMRKLTDHLDAEMDARMTTGLVLDATNVRKVMMRNYDEARPVDRLVNCPPGVIVHPGDQVMTIRLHGKETIVVNLTAQRSLAPLDPDAPTRLADGSFVV